MSTRSFQAAQTGVAAAVAISKQRVRVPWVSNRSLRFNRRPRRFSLWDNKEQTAVLPLRAANANKFDDHHHLLLAAAAEDDDLEIAVANPDDEEEEEEEELHDQLAAESVHGCRVRQGRVHRQRVMVRSFDIDRHKKATIAALMRQIQDSACNHATRCSGVELGRFASTPFMTKNNLGWVITCIQMVVDQYPACTCVMMNYETRRLHKFVQEVRDELACCIVPVEESVVPKNEQRLPRLDFETAERVTSGLTSRWFDLDVNHHVNNVKYVDWILDSVPRSLPEGHELRAMTIQFRKEVAIDTVVHSLSRRNNSGSNAAAAAGSGNGNGADNAPVEVDHLLCLEDGSEILRARTTWKPKKNLN
ncbi:unnamed protein product [Linum tenue]|uniref:Acyl-[acyl-carrier-protein] hydrolase n=1 Tax=Linum tenue TaxID=586396 RepID=A0AAV0PMZ3_9ROSI|nr:unnamed protein product [Linum tenue]